MKRKDFLRSSIPGVFSIVGISAIIGHCNDVKENNRAAGVEDCDLSPRETRGPFPNKTPAQLVKSNIRLDRKGVALLINLTILDKNNACKPLPGAIVDIWHCDKDGYYSEYGNHPMQHADLTREHFLRGRQMADDKGRISFLSIYPGWYSGRAPHIHLEIFNINESSLLVTQIAFPDKISDQVYTSSLYAGRGQADTSNSRDGIFRDSLDQQLALITGNINDGFTLSKEIIVKA